MEKLLTKALNNAQIALKDKRIHKVTPIQGGCIHKAWRIDLENNQKLFVKTTSINNFNMFLYESEGLIALQKYADESLIYIPTPLTLQKIDNISLLFLPWMNLTHTKQSDLGTGLALMHKSSSQSNQKHFGWEKDGFIGTNPQVKGWAENWGEYFITFRLKPQLEIASQWGLKVNTYKKLLSSLIPFLNDHKPMPSLVHGDLWSGNIGFKQNGQGCLFDPATYWADREVDLAMTKLFGGFSQDFYESYQKIWPLSNSAEERFDIYNLYHILNHANLFGGSYQNQSINILKKIGSIF